MRGRVQSTYETSFDRCDGPVRRCRACRRARRHGLEVEDDHDYDDEAEDDDDHDDDHDDDQAEDDHHDDDDHNHDTKPTLLGGTVVLGATKTAVVPPTCSPNSGCYVVLTRVTAIPTIRDGVAYPTKVKVAGSLVAFTLGLAKITKTATQTPHQVIARPRCELRGHDSSVG